MLDKTNVTNYAEVTFPVAKYSEVLEVLRHKISPYCWEKVEKEKGKSTTSYNSMLCPPEKYVVTTQDETFEVNVNLTACNCNQYNKYRLPCSHIIYLAERHDICIPIDSRWELQV